MALRTGTADWNPPANVIAAGNAARTVYRNAPLRSEIDPRHKSATRTQLPLGGGTIALRDAIVARFPGVRQTHMPGRSRPMTDSQRLDMHQAGRAVDFMTSDKALGDAIANHLVLNADDMGIQYVVWAGNRWSSGSPAGHKWDQYTGSSMHRDHPHVELTPEAANGSAPFFAGRSIPNAQQRDHATANEKEAGYMDHGEPSTMILPIVAIVGGVLVIAGLVWSAKKR